MAAAAQKTPFPALSRPISLSVFQDRRFESTHADRTMQSCCEPRTAVLGGGGGGGQQSSSLLGGCVAPEEELQPPGHAGVRGRRLQRTRAELAPH